MEGLEKAQQAEGVEKEKALEEAIRGAMNQGADACQCMKTALLFDFIPYLVLRDIYSYGSIEIDELCMCGTEEGILKEVIAKAAVDAAGPNGEKIYSGDQVKQSQCLQTGLPYTATAADLPDAPEFPDPVPPDSVSSP